jgi:serine/threonine protein kinase/Flp pilus assembly protein TadD
MNLTEDGPRGNRQPATDPASGVPAEPDDPRVLQAVEEYLAARQAGRRPDRQEFLARFPDIAPALADCLDGLEFIQAAAPQLTGRQESGDRSQGSGSTHAVPSDSCLLTPDSCLLGDYRLVREIGRGGMGVVYEAEQVSLGRRVALKVLPFAAALDGKQLQRFKTEAQAAAHLHHQHIVPVHAVGCERGVHYYAMQLIDGRTLAAVVGEQRRLAGLDPDPRASDGEATGLFTPSTPGPKTDAPGETATFAVAPPPPSGGAPPSSARSPEYFRTAARLAVQAAQALEHAHQLGVIHRDVKPANLIVDALGHLWVTDFGLAQMQSDARLTRTGDVVGTLRYMSPEQALAQRTGIDHRTDVYSLGATLYELLTLEPVFPGNDRQELLRQIAFEEPRPPQRLNRAVPADLATVCLKALAKNADERYATAQELADDLGRYLEDRPIRARRPTAAQRLRKWARRHRAVVSTAAVALVVLVVALAGVGGWSLHALGEQERERAQQEQRDKEKLDDEKKRNKEKLDEEKKRSDKGVRESVAKARELVKARRWPAALPLAADALARLEYVKDNPALRAKVTELGKVLALLARLEDIDTAKLDSSNLNMVVLGNIEGRLPLDRPATVYGPALTEYGIDVTVLTIEEAADRIRGRLIEDDLVEALDDWARQERDDELRNRLLTIARLVNPQGLQAEWRALQSRLVQARTNKDDAAASAVEAEIVQFTARIKIENTPPATLAFLGRSLIQTRLNREGLHVLRSAHWHYPDSFEINNDLGYAYSIQKPPQWVEALRHYSAATAARPRTAGLYLGLGNTLAKLERRDEAMRVYRKALELKPDFAAAHNNLGILWWQAGDALKAEAAYRKSLEFKPDSPMVLTNLGRLLIHDKARWKEAREVLDRAVKLAPKFPNPYSSIGSLLARQGKTEEAEAAYRKAIDLNDGFGEAHHNLAGLLADQGKFQQAIAHSQKAVKAMPDEVVAHSQFGATWSEWARRERAELGAVTAEVLAKMDRAEARLRDAIAVKPDHPEAWYSLGNVLRDRGELDRAAAAFQEATWLRPKYADAHYNLGNVYSRLGLYDKALAAYRAAVAADPDQGKAHHSLGTALAYLKRFADAESASRTALARGAEPQATVNLGITLQRLGRFEEALGLFKLVQKQLPPGNSARQHAEALIPTYVWYVSIDKNLEGILAGENPLPSPDAFLHTAVVCAARNLPAAAARYYKEGFARNPGLEDDPGSEERYNAACVAALAARGAGKDKPAPDAKERAAWRQQALAWLRADLAGWAQRLQKKGQPAAIEVLRTLHRWQRDPDLAVLRDQDQSPDAQKLWADVKVLLQRARGYQQRVQPMVPVHAKVLTGALTATDPKDTFPLTSKSHHKVHVVSLEGGQPYLIDLQGKFDTFLRVEDAQRKPLLFNDDVRADDLSSRLVFLPPEKGDYRIVVTSYQPGVTGPYTLTIREAVAVGRPVIDHGELKDTTKKTPDGRHAVFHKVTLSGSAPCTIELASQKFDTYLILFDATEKQVLAENDDIAPGNTRLSRIDYTPRGEEAVTIVVTSFQPGETGPYTLTIRRYEPVKWAPP